MKFVKFIVTKLVIPIASGRPKQTFLQHSESELKGRVNLRMRIFVCFFCCPINRDKVIQHTSVVNMPKNILGAALGSHALVTPIATSCVEANCRPWVKGPEWGAGGIDRALLASQAHCLIVLLRVWVRCFLI